MFKLLRENLRTAIFLLFISDGRFQVPRLQSVSWIFWYVSVVELYTWTCTCKLPTCHHLICNSMLHPFHHLRHLRQSCDDSSSEQMRQTEKCNNGVCHQFVHSRSVVLYPQLATNGIQVRWNSILLFSNFVLV